MALSVEEADVRSPCEHAQKRILGERGAHVGAKFVPVVPGLTRGHPLPIGAAANIGQGLVVKVSQQPERTAVARCPGRGRNFDANLTVIYTGEGFQVPTGSASPSREASTPPIRPSTTTPAVPLARNRVWTSRIRSTPTHPSRAMSAGQSPRTMPAPLSSTSATAYTTSPARPGSRSLTRPGNGGSMSPIASSSRTAPMRGRRPTR